jgi:hypothetical protein
VKKVTEEEFNSFLASRKKYEWHPVTMADKVLVFDNNKDRNIIAEKRLGADYETEYLIKE